MPKPLKGRKPRADYTQRKKISRGVKAANAKKKAAALAATVVIDKSPKQPPLTVEQRKLKGKDRPFRYADAMAQKAAYEDNRSVAAKRGKVPTEEGTKEAEEARAEERKKIFLDAFVDIDVSFGTIFQTCRWLKNLGHAGIGPQTVQRWRKVDPLFAEAFIDALHSIDEQIDGETVRRAVVGWQEPVYGALGVGPNGQVLGTGEVGRIQKFSDPLLIDIRKARRQFGEPTKAKQPPSDGTPLRGELTDADRIAGLNALAESVRARLAGQTLNGGTKVESNQQSPMGSSDDTRD